MGVVLLFVFFLVVMQISIWYNAFRFLKYDEIRIANSLFQTLQLATGVGFPVFFLYFMDFGNVNDCCGETAVFAPEHKLGIYLLIAIYLTSFSISIFRKKMFPPLFELVLNVFIMLGLIINVLVAFQIGFKDLNGIFILFGTVPVVFVLLFQLVKNHKIHSKHLNELVLNQSTLKMGWAVKVLQSPWWQKSVILLLLCAPVVIIFSLILVLFGQKPDTLVQAFTQTYKQGFSQLDHECANVQCGGHFLCSVGALGSPEIVHPVRYGIRNKETIICTRQLLISNAFEEVVETKFPKFHQFIRRNYNHVGNVIHKYYYWFEIKWVSNTVYVLMKPLEWIFLIALYSADVNPENRINRQYLPLDQKEFIRTRAND